MKFEDYLEQIFSDEAFSIYDRDFMQDRLDEYENDENTLHPNLIMIAYDSGILEDISHQDKIGKAFFNSYVKILVEKYGLSIENANWAVRTCCCIYGNKVLSIPCRLPKDAIVVADVDAKLPYRLQEIEDAVRDNSELGQQNEGIERTDLMDTVDAVSEVLNSFLKLLNLYTEGVEVLKADLAHFIMYVAFADGEIDHIAEREIRRYLAISDSAGNIEDYIMTHNIDSADFGNDVPASIMTVVTADNLLKTAGSMDRCSADIVLKVFVAVGIELFEDDKNISPHKLRNYNQYIQTLTEYICENDDFKKDEG